MNEKTYSPKEIARILKIPKATVLRAIMKKELPAERYNNRVFRVSSTDCAAWYASKGGKLKTK